jgi:uncharacterized protein (DUF1499 family)
MDPSTSTSFRERLGPWLAGAALAVGLLCAAAALLAGPGYRMEVLSLGAGIQTIRWAATIALGAGVAALIAMMFAATIGVRRGLLVAAAALVVNALVAAPPIYLYRQAKQLPSIHDISTDTDNPPAFKDVLPRRVGAKNPVDYRPEVAAEQKKGYPDVLPLLLDESAPQAFERAERTARAMGWEIVSASPQELRIEATDTTLLFGFKDDVVIRITPQGARSIVDVRSLSRVGGSDIGTNAKRIRAFLRKLAA